MDLSGVVQQTPRDNFFTFSGEDIEAARKCKGEKDKKSNRSSAYKSPNFVKNVFNDIKPVLGTKHADHDNKSDKTEEMA